MTAKMKGKKKKISAIKVKVKTKHVVINIRL